MRAGDQLTFLGSDRHREVNRLAPGRGQVSSILATRRAPRLRVDADAARAEYARRIGSGRSTLMARRVIETAGLDTRIVVFDPYPRTDMRAASNELNRCPSSIRPSPEARQAGDILFIDSRHICRTRGDSLSVLPRHLCVARRVVARSRHPFHRTARQWCHTEEYFSRALFRTLAAAASCWLGIGCRDHPDAMNRALGPFRGRTGRRRTTSDARFGFEVLG